MRRIFAAGFIALGVACAPRGVEIRRSEALDMVVTASVADVRAKPVPHAGEYKFDPDQETQVLRGERVIAREQKAGWTLVECIEQPEFTHSNKWEGYPGWVRSDALSSDDGSVPRIQELALPEKSLRAMIIQQAERHINERYLWGGRSLFDAEEKSVLTGVDCSGLVNWSFRQAGRIVPRDAHEQFMKARPIEPAALKPGDLVFLAKAEKPERIVHVAFYAGDGFILEAPQSGERVRKISVLARFGRKLEELKDGQTVDDRVLHFGTLIGGK
jgi:hypothetical protein